MLTLPPRAHLRPPSRGTAGLVVFPAALVLASGVAPLAGTSTATRVALGIGATLALALLSVLVTRSPRLRPAQETLLVLTALSVFGWASTLIAAIPAVDGWLRTAPVPLAFLVTNAMKVTSLLPLLLVARGRPGVRARWLLRAGNPNAGTGIPYLRWPVLGPVVIVVVAALFLTALPASAFGRLGAAVAWLPVMLLGAAVNAVSEELLYRHATIGAASAVIGTWPAVLLSSAVFGLGHLTGNPGGLVGVLWTAAYGAVCALAMLRTRGMCWNLPIHVFGDLAIVLTLFLAGSHGV